MQMDLLGILGFLVSFAILASIYGIFSMGLNVHWGYTGLLNFGIAGFFAVGAYASALITTAKPTGALASYAQQAIGFDLPFVFGVLGAAIVAALIAALVGLLTLRLSEGYLAIATIGIAEVIRLVFNNERWLANGAQGMIGLPRPLHDLVAPRHYNFIYLAIVLVFLVLIYLAVERGIRSPWGRVLRAIREDEVMAQADGKDVFKFKLQALALGAAIMGVGGALYAHYTATIQPGLFTPLFGTFIIWVMLTLGGTGNSKGAILGAFVVWAIWQWSATLIIRVVPQELATRAPFLRFVLIGLLLVVFTVKWPGGLIGEEREVSRF